MRESHKPTEPLEQLFTIFCRRDEAVRVAQFQAKDVSDAVNIWISRELPSVASGSEEGNAIGAELRADEPGLVEGCKNVWVVTAFPIWLDIVATSE